MTQKDNTMSTSERRYDIDWVRVIAIGLLLIYHVAIGVQPWGVMIGFIASEKSWASLWIPMTMLNVWRIPLLFFVSGMGVYFAIQNRTWSQLMMERSLRILLPFVFGTFCIFPISSYLWQRYYHLAPNYAPNPGHLWFLGNIFIYVIALTPVFFYLKANQDGQIINAIKRAMRMPLGLVPVVLVFILEAMIIKPIPYELYAMTWHGFFLGLFAFFFGFVFVLSGRVFWDMIVKWRWMFISIAIILFLFRILYFKMHNPAYLLVAESDSWIISVFAFAYIHLNRPGKVLNYLSQAAYPVYILHMIFLYLGSMLIFPLDISAPLQFLLVLLFTVAGCYGFYEFVIRRINIIRPLFGLKMKSRDDKGSGAPTRKTIDIFA